MAMSGTTSLVDNAPLFLPNQPLVYDWLNERQIPWCAYQAGHFLPFFTLMPAWTDEIATSLALDALVPHAHPRFRRFSNFARDWLSEQNMPSVIFIEPEYTDALHAVPNDDHPPTGVAQGQAFVADIYNALIANPVRWSRTLLIVTYDEHGGFFDHVPPLAIPTQIPNHGPVPVFVTTGLRVPAFIISPLVEPAAVFRSPLDHTSILQLIADRFGSGLYSPAVYERQASLSPLSAAITRTEPRANPLSAPALAPPPVMAPVARLAPGATANALAFRLAASKIAADHAGIAVGWPALARAAAER
jgi:phospholipase C